MMPKMGHYFDLEDTAYRLAQRGFHLDLVRTLADRVTLTAHWRCTLRPWGRYEGDHPHGEGETAVLAIRAAEKQIRHPTLGANP